jgi:hypothetical protein
VHAKVAHALQQVNRIRNRNLEVWLLQPISKACIEQLDLHGSWFLLGVLFDCKCATHYPARRSHAEPRGHLRLVIAFTITDDKIMAIEAIADSDRLGHIDLAVPND